MAIRHDEHQEKISLDEFCALLERDPEHRYELIDGYSSMITGESPDHAIIGLKIGSILRESNSANDHASRITPLCLRQTSGEIVGCCR